MREFDAKMEAPPRNRPELLTRNGVWRKQEWMVRKVNGGKPGRVLVMRTIELLMVAAGKFAKWAKIGVPARGHIAPLDHGYFTAFRTARMRELK